MLITLTPSHHWARITHILLAVQLLPLSAILLSHHQILGLAFLPIGVSTVVSSALLRLRARGEDDLHSAARALLDAVVAAGLVIVLTLTVVLSWWAGEVGLLEVYTGFLVIISL